MTEPIDVTRKMTGGRQKEQADEVTEGVYKRKQIKLFQKAVVTEVLGDPSLRTKEYFEKAADELSIVNFGDLREAPRNSLLAIPIDGGQGREKNPPTQVICFPFFSSHIALPVKPGETVWIMYITPEEASTRAYWLSRVCDKDFVEDANFTHHDRRHELPWPDPYGDGARSYPPRLNNGYDVDETTEKFITAPGEENPSHFTLPEADSFVKIRQDSLESSRFVVEPVPRITKRPGDLVLQGSNNTAIILGTDRGYTLKAKPDGKATSAAPSKEAVQEGPEKLDPLRGTIDLVVGRGRFYKKKDTKFDFGTVADADPERTRGRVVKTGEENFVVDKNIATHPDHGDPEKEAEINLEKDINEGDPDYINDSGRIYVSMQTDVDANFGIDKANIPTAYDKEPDKTKLEDKVQAASIVVKSDEVRIVARKTQDKSKAAEYGDVEEVNGSIRLIKEGDPTKDGACIYILPDGTIQISGSKIMLGRHEKDEGTSRSEELDPDVGKAEPYMRYKEFSEWADGLIDAINSAFETAEKGINGNGDACNMMGSIGASGGTVAAVAGGPNVPLGLALKEGIMPPGATGQHKHAPDKSKIEDFKSDKDAMKAIRSKRIFGE